MQGILIVGRRSHLQLHFQIGKQIHSQFHQAVELFYTGTSHRSGDML